MAYSAWRLVREGLNAHRGWHPIWRKAALKPSYDAVIVGAGGHGLATAFHLARDHGLSVAVIEKGWLGGGNTGRNTTVVRTNYLYPESAAFYNHSLRAFEKLSRTLNYNVMFRQSGLLTLIHDRHTEARMRRLSNAMRRAGSRAEILSVEQARKKAPIADYSPAARYPVRSAFFHAEAGVVRHDAVAWGYARAADRLGVDIVEKCEVTDFLIAGGAIEGVETTRGTVRTGLVGMAVAGHSSVLAQRAGVELPITSYALQAVVSEPIKPVLDPVLVSAATGIYLSQSDKGELVIGGGLDLYPSYAQRGNIANVEAIAAALIATIPAASRLKLMRQWAGIVDISPDSSPILDATTVRGLFVSCGWGTGGFKAIPAGGEFFARLIATGDAHPLIAPFALSRFRDGSLIDEGAAAGIAH